MTALKTFFALHPGRWRAIKPSMFLFGLTTVIGAAFVLAFNRFGGLLLDAPQQFVQLLVYPLWGWLGMGVAIWFLGARVVDRVGSNADQPTLVATLTSVGFAHRPLFVWGAVMSISTGLFQITGPGLVAAAIVFGIWMPLLLALSVQHSRYITLQQSFTVIALPYVFWLLIVGRHLLTQLSHQL